MTTATGNNESNSAPWCPGIEANSSASVPLAKRHAAILREIASAKTPATALNAIATALPLPGPDTELLFLQQSPSQEWATHTLRKAESGKTNSLRDELLQALCADACKQGLARQISQDDHTAALAMPVFYQDRSPDVYLAVFDPRAGGRQELESSLHFASLYLSLWATLQRYSIIRQGSVEQKELLCLLNELHAWQSTKDVAHCIADFFVKCSGASRCAVGIVAGNGRSCRLEAISDVANIDSRSEYVRAVEEAISEAELSEQVCTYHHRDDQGQHQNPGCERLARVAEAAGVASLQLQDRQGQCVAVIVLIIKHNTPVPRAQLESLLDRTQVIGTALQFAQGAQRGRGSRLAAAARSVAGKGRRRIVLVALLLVLLSLAIPLPHRISTDCSVEPIVRRFIAAPFDGTLERTLVEPGIEVSSNQPLARLDDRALQWKITALEADYKQASKRRDTALANRDGSAAQLAGLEMDQAKSEMQLAEYHRDHLTIRSPIDGVIIRGDLDRAVGAPVQVGETLFEVAPLDRMVVELAIPEHAIAYVTQGARVRVQLEAFPGHSWYAELEKPQPRAEVLDNENVFLAEVTLENEDGTLRPGMKGTAKITAASKPLGWILFHRPMNKLAQWFGW